jgi:butyrate kinase
MITGKGGFVAYLGTNNAYDVEQRVNAGDQQAKEIQEAMAYQIAKEIGRMAVALNCDIDAILLTGGVAYNKDIVDYITQKVKKIAPVAAYPGEDEMHALAMNGLMLSNGDITAMEYK